eukprot:1006124-Pleurochrysis_carterae.AAC.1
MMLQATDTLPLNFGFSGKGNTSDPKGLMVRFANAERKLRSVPCLAILRPGDHRQEAWGSLGDRSLWNLSCLAE